MGGPAGRRVGRLRVSHAFHSPLVEPMLADFGDIAAHLAYTAPAIPVVSTVTGRLATAETAPRPGLLGSPRPPTGAFQDAVRALESADVSTFVELGPGGVLAAMGPACLTAATAEEIDQLDETLSSISPDGGELIKLTTRLETLLHKWNDAHNNSAPAEPVADYGAATDDELFKDFGTANSAPERALPRQPLVERLSDARRNGHLVLAVVRGSAGRPLWLG